MSNRLVLCLHKDSDYNDPSNYVFMDRKYVDDINNLELGQKFLQLIPAIIVKNQKDEVLSYARNGNETRLHGSRSILIGGHIDIEDIFPIFTHEADWNRIIQLGAQRELHEEVNVWRSVHDLEVETTIYTDKDDVSSVHLGLIITVITDSTDDIEPSDELHDVLWLSKDKLLDTQELYEEWSKIAINKL